MSANGATSVPRRLAFWLTVKQEASRMDVLGVEIGDGEEALPVFSFEEEARISGDFVSALLGPCSARTKWCLIRCRRPSPKRWMLSRA